ncbi:MAG: SDR family oxidoreductase [Planctomycetota bacterium]|nr:SDR family oxidoreductase [Planctomycetota bacterium]
MTKTAIIGASGFVGRHLLKAYRRAHPDTIGTSFSQARADLAPFDIRKPDLASLKLREKGYQAVLVTSAKPNIGYCEQHKEEAYAVNVGGMLELLRQAAGLGLQPIFLSTDYVFDGVTGGYDDDAPTRPGTEYGRQKEAVEKELPRIAANHLVIRLSKIYGVDKGDATLLDDFASSLLAGKPLSVATDQVFSPTFVDDLVASILAIQEKGLRGVVNVCSPEAWSRYDVAAGMAKELGLDPARINAIKLHSLAAMAGRPLNTSMKCSRLAAASKPAFTPLRDQMRRVAANWKPG